ncbi:MAG: RNA polymerase sigma factor [Planctomycetes bacterium]|nr:RNA polymerase sigma factor [Planctomycetota bacterium]
MARATDKELLAAIARRDNFAGREFFLRHRQGAFRVAYRLLGNEADALDVVEDAFVKIMKAAAGFRGEASVRTWFYRIVTNTALDARRRRSRFVALETADEDAPGLKEILPSREESPPAAALRKETAQKIREAVALLGEKHRTVFVLVVVEGLSYRETAGVLGISPGTVMSRLFYARKYLQESLRKYVETDSE